MASAPLKIDPADYARCRNLVWETSPEDGSPVPGRYCSSGYGVFHHLDCPVFQGRACTLYDPRPADEEVVAASPERIVELRLVLSEDYLRMLYFRRVGRLMPDAESGAAETLPHGTRRPGRGGKPIRRSTAGRRRRHPPAR